MWHPFRTKCPLLYGLWNGRIRHRIATTITLIVVGQLVIGQLAGAKVEIGTGQDGQPARALVEVALDAAKAEDRTDLPFGGRIGAHSYRSASTGSSRAALHAG